MTALGGVSGMTARLKLKPNMVGTIDVENVYFSTLSCIKYINSYNSHMQKILIFKSELKNKLFCGLQKENIEYIDLDNIHCVYNILAFIVVGIKTSLIKQKLNSIKIAIGSGSACTTSVGSSTVLALGFSKEISQQLVRLSFNYTDTELINNFVEEFVKCVKDLQFIKRKTNIAVHPVMDTIIYPSLRKIPNIENIPVLNINSLELPCIDTIILSSADQSLKGKNKNKFDKIMRNTINKLLKIKVSDFSFKIFEYDNIFIINTYSISIMNINHWYAFRNAKFKHLHCDFTL
jgi:hypothetical protein